MAVKYQQLPDGKVQYDLCFPGLVLAQVIAPMRSNFNGFEETKKYSITRWLWKCELLQGEAPSSCLFHIWIEYSDNFIFCPKLFKHIFKFASVYFLALAPLFFIYFTNHFWCHFSLSFHNSIFFITQGMRVNYHIFSCVLLFILRKASRELR